MINLELIDAFKQEEWDFNRVCMKDPDNKLVDFFYSGHYLLMSIKHIFAGGSFTQSITGNMMVLTSSVENALANIGTKQK